MPGAAAADDDNGHGTHTAGTIAAAANEGPASSAWRPT